jgi:hypothetical protein
MYRGMLHSIASACVAAEADSPHRDDSIAGLERLLSQNTLVQARVAATCVVLLPLDSCSSLTLLCRLASAFNGVRVRKHFSPYQALSASCCSLNRCWFLSLLRLLLCCARLRHLPAFPCLPPPPPLCRCHPPCRQRCSPFNPMMLAFRLLPSQFSMQMIYAASPGMAAPATCATATMLPPPMLFCLKYLGRTRRRFFSRSCDDGRLAFISKSNVLVKGMTAVLCRHFGQHARQRVLKRGWGWGGGVIS